MSRVPPAQQDLKRSLGLKFGGQISITSSDQASTSRPQQQGVSMYKGSMEIGKTREQRPTHRQQQDPTVEVKEEPEEPEDASSFTRQGYQQEEEEEGYGDEDFAGMDEFEMGEVDEGDEDLYEEEEGFIGAEEEEEEEEEG